MLLSPNRLKFTLSKNISVACPAKSTLSNNAIEIISNFAIKTLN